MQEINSLSEQKNHRKTIFPHAITQRKVLNNNKTYASARRFSRLLTK